MSKGHIYITHDLRCKETKHRLIRTPRPILILLNNVESPKGITKRWHVKGRHRINRRYKRSIKRRWVVKMAHQEKKTLCRKS